MPTAVVTGASRGIGLEFVRQYLEDGWTVHAGARSPDAATGLADLACDRLSVHRLDVSDHEQIAALGRSLEGTPVDVLVNNAGMWIDEDETLGRFTDAAWMEQFEVHLFGVMAMCEALIESIAASQQRRIVNISSGNGSFGWEKTFGEYPYNTTKAALNMLTMGLAHDLADRGVTVMCFTPGFVATDMTDHASDLKPLESVGGMRALVAGLDTDRSGIFLRYNGEAMPW